MCIDKIFINNTKNLSLFLEESIVHIKDKPQDFMNFLDNYFIKFHFQYGYLCLPLLQEMFKHPFYFQFFSLPQRQEKLIYFILNNFIDKTVIEKIPHLNLYNNLTVVEIIKDCNKVDYLDFLKYYLEKNIIDANLLFNYRFVSDFKFFNFLLNKVNNSFNNNNFIKDFILTKQLKNINKSDILSLKRVLNQRDINFSIAQIIQYYHSSMKFNKDIYSLICLCISDEDCSRFIDFCNDNLNLKVDEKIMLHIENRANKIVIKNNLDKQNFLNFIKKKNLEKEYQEFNMKRNSSKL